MPLEDSSISAMSNHIDANADHEQIALMKESGSSGLTENKHISAEHSTELEESKGVQACLIDVPHLFNCPSFYLTCLNAFLNAFPSPDKEHLAYLSCRILHCLVSAATATISDNNPLRVFSALGRDTEFDSWIVHNFVLYHSTALGKAIHYDVVRPNKEYGKDRISDSNESALTDMFVDVVSGKSFAPIHRYDIIILTHTLESVPPDSLATMFNSLLTPGEHGYMIVVEAPSKGPYPESSLMQTHQPRSYLEEMLDTLNPQDSLYEVICVDDWMDVENACKDPDNPNVELLSFSTGRDLRNVTNDALMVIQAEINIQSFIRRCQYEAWSPSCFALVYRMYHLPVEMLDCTEI